MGHHHDHHDHEASTEMPFREKLAKLLEHWIRHNEDHAATYRQWAGRAKAEGLSDQAALLEEAARMNLETNEKFRAALAGMR